MAVGCRVVGALILLPSFFLVTRLPLLSIPLLLVSLVVPPLAMFSSRICIVYAVEGQIEADALET